MSKKAGPVDVRFWEMVDKRGPDECWVWKGMRNKFGYGRIHAFGRMGLAHRISYILNVGTIEPGNFICHKCDNPPCVNPAHLFQGTAGDNNRDATAKGHNFYQPGHVLNVGSRNPKSKLQEADVEFIRLNFKKFPYKVLAEKFNVSVATICNVVHGRTWTKVEKVTEKRRPGCSKLTIEQVNEICQKYPAAGLSELGREYGVTPSAIQYLVRKFKNQQTQ